MIESATLTRDDRARNMRHARERAGRGPDLFTAPRPAAQDPWPSLSTSALWREAALEEVRRVAGRTDTFTVADLDVPDHAQDARAVGNVLLEAARRGWIEATDRYASGGAARHGRPVRVWRSKLSLYATNAEPDQKLGAVIDPTEATREIRSRF